MGHTRLGSLPRTRRWQQVIGLIAEGASAPEIAAATLRAAEKGFKDAAKDDTLLKSFWLLTQLPLLARRENFLETLRQLGLPVSNQPTLMEMAGAFSEAVDSSARQHRTRTDVGEMAQLSAVASLTRLVGQEIPSLFEAAPSDLQRALGGFATKKQFSGLAREFFARFTERYLKYFLSKELSNHVGPRRPFSNIHEHSSFSQALETHCRQASRIIEEFSVKWFSKTNFEGGITPQKAAFCSRSAQEDQSRASTGCNRQWITTGSFCVAKRNNTGLSIQKPSV